MKGTPRLLFLGVAGLAAWFGLALQVWVAFEAMWAEGFSTPAALVKVLSYFTILTNGLVAVCYLADFIFCLQRKKANPRLDTKSQRRDDQHCHGRAGLRVAAASPAPL
jgi:hypothetical protein